MENMCPDCNYTGQAESIVSHNRSVAVLEAEPAEKNAEIIRLSGLLTKTCDELEALRLGD